MRESLFCLCLAAVLSQAAHAGTYRLLALEGQNVKWGAPELGTGASVTYAILDGAASASGVRNCKAAQGVEPLLEYAGISRAVLETELAAAVATWEQVADIKFQRTSDATSADIRIGTEISPDGWAFADVRPGEAQSGKVASIEKGTVCLNPERAWRGRSDAPEGGETFDLRYVLTHELGHILGLDHPGGHGGLMAFNYDGQIYELQAGDIAGARILYGPPTSQRQEKALTGFLP